MPNAGHGVRVLDSAQVDLYPGNVIGPNAGDGIRLEGTTHDARLWFNYIGIDYPSGNPLGNGGAGVAIVEASNNLIGLFGGTNVIAHNGAGVAISGAGAVGNLIRHNSIHSNTGLGIDLGADGPTPNDADDTDEGPNHLQNFPVIALVTPGAFSLTVEGSIES